MARDPKVDRLAQVELFADLDDDALDALAGIVDEVTFPKDSTICREGETGSEALVLTSGGARVTAKGRQITDDLRADRRRRAGPGQQEGRAGATVTANAETEALSVPARSFDGLLDDHPSIARGLLRVLADRIAEANTHPGSLGGSQS